MYQNVWIANYLSHVKCCQGITGEAVSKVARPKLQQRAFSFQTQLSSEDKDDVAQTTKTVDVSPILSLPKVSELRKRFEHISNSQSDCWDMNRKERIARRLEGIDSDVQFSLPSAGLVTNRLLEEDTPRYTRANDLCDPCAVPVQHFIKDESGMSDPHSSGSVTQHRNQMETSMAQTETTNNPGSAVTVELESKADRIARYKAERRRQLCERYRILLDEEADTDHASLYSRMRRDPEGSERQYRGQVEGKDEMEHNANTANVRASRIPASANVEPEYSREKGEVFSEHERRMNLENQKRALDRGRMHGEGEAPDHSAPYIDTSGETRAQREQEVTDSPKASRPAKQVASIGDLFSHQPTHNILHKHGSCPIPEPQITEVDEEKLDERAKMSVAAKRSLFRELEKSVDGAALKAQNQNAALARRLRRGQDRYRTQPITSEEVVIAAT